MIRISHVDDSLTFVLIQVYVFYLPLRAKAILSLLSVLRMLLGQLGSQCRDLGLQRGHLIFVLLFHACHASLDIAHILPDIDALVAHEFTRAGTTTSAVTRHATRLRRGSRC